MGGRRSWLGPTAGGVLVVGTLAGLLVVLWQGPAPSCLDAPLVVAPATAAPGDTVMVSAPPASCSFGKSDRSYSVAMEYPSADPVEVASSVPAGRHGEFSVPVVVPPDAPAGEQVVMVRGSAYDRCGGPDDCQGYFVRLTVTAGP